MNTNSSPYPIEKIISVLSYLTGGFAGFLYVIVAAIWKLSLRPFVKYHIYQSIFLSILCFLIMKVFELLLPVFNIIPGINVLINNVIYVLCMNTIFLNFSFFDIIVFAVILYLCMGVIRSKYTYVPWVSDIIKYHVNSSK